MNYRFIFSTAKKYERRIHFSDEERTSTESKINFRRTNVLGKSSCPNWQITSQTTINNDIVTCFEWKEKIPTKYPEAE